MKKKTILLIISIITIILIVSLMYFFSLKKNTYHYSTQEKAKIKKEIQESANTLTSESVTLDDVKNILKDKKALNIFVTVGEQSYLNNKPTDKIIKKYNLQSLVQEQKKYVSKVEKKYLDNLKYEIVSESVEGNRLCENIEIVTYYYSLYLNDYINIMSSELDFPLEDIEKEKNQVEYYKLQVQALKVLDNYLDDYDNIKHEKEKVEVCYRNGALEDESQMLTLSIALQGELYSNMDMNDETVVNKANERLQKYLEEIKALR